MQKGK
jgi:hypothetical protein